MNAVTSEGPLTVDDWLEALLTADPVELRMIAIEAMKASGIAVEPVECVLHGLTLTFVGAWRHLVDTETEWRRTHPEDGINAALHRLGDLRGAPARAAQIRDENRYTVDYCTRKGCGAPVIWASSPRGKTVPIDAAPDPGGHIMLTTDPEDDTARPNAIWLHTEYEREQVPPARRHHSHMTTCKASPTS